MPPMFIPGPFEYGLPPIYTGGFGPKMCEMAGEVADGLIVHPFNNLPYIQEHVLDNVRKGLVKGGGTEQDFTLSISAMVITGSTEENYDNAYQGIRSLLAFYGSTPAYIPAMKAIGFEDLQPELNRLSKENKMKEMEALIPDDFIQQFAVIGEPESIARQLLDKYGSLADRLSLYTPYYAENDVWRDIIRDIKLLQSV